MISGYIKSLREWLKLKIGLCDKQSKIVFKQGDIWWCSIGANLGEEIMGKGLKFTRPVLVFRKFTANSFLGLPLTTQDKKGSWYVHIKIRARANWVMLNQARILDKKRLTSRISVLDDTDFRSIQNRFLEFYGS